MPDSGGKLVKAVDINVEVSGNVVECCFSW